ncbi:hypothetical protein F1559_000508 [Cyanidiococcus yangmingshanensis]|uniref:GATA-type domain-containing protein n=1 Tax=Cyanidiococcus yangmingshanensis TaxID=2690220 RepID=A0A7J7ICU5_9RHOD|nr:hypothetical protein F1559_000508 [Cyanidiococcus yangmingshanensis]
MLQHPQSGLKRSRQVHPIDRTRDNVQTLPRRPFRLTEKVLVVRVTPNITWHPTLQSSVMPTGWKRSCQQNILWPPLLGRISSSFLLLQETMVRDWMRYQHRLGTVLPKSVAGAGSSTSSMDGGGANHSPRVATSYRQLLSQVSRKLHSWTRRTHVAMSVTGVSAVPLQTDLAAMDPNHAGSPSETKHSIDHDPASASWLYHPNPCRPLQGRRYMTLAAYAHSLHQFIDDAGDMAYRIVDELLSPDAERERLVKQWRLEVAAWEKQLEEAQEARMEQFDEACQSFRDKVLRLQQEGVDLDWLRDTVFDAELAEQVESVPLDTIDDSAPYGVSSKELQALRDYLWERTNTYGKRIPWLDAMIQLSEQQPLPGQTWSPKGFLSSAIDTSYQERLSKSVAGTNSATDQTWRGKQAAGHVRSLAASDQAATRPRLPEVSRPPSPVTIATSGVNQTNSSHRFIGKTGPTLASSSVPVPDTPLCCANCGTADTPGWRQGETKDQRLCNACGLFWVKYKRHRPPNLWRQGSRPTKPLLTPSTATPANATTNPGRNESTSMSR